MFNPSVIFLAFSNSISSFLPSLKKESDLIYTALLPVSEEEKSFVLRREESAENKDINFYLGRYKDRLAIFHYAGHAEGKLLSFEDSEGNADGLANLLGLQNHLKVVFLNACSTKEQAFLYINAGVKAVIATSIPVQDAHAMLFAGTFYTALANRHTIEEAYLEAVGALKQRFSEYGEHPNSIVFYENVFKELPEPEEEETARVEETIKQVDNIQYITRKLVRRGYKPNLATIPWRLYVNADHKDVLQWKITEPPIKEYLQEGSAAYYKKLFKSRFHYITFDRKVYSKNEAGKTVETDLVETLKSTWALPTKHTFLIGKGGTGKTTNTIILWKRFLQQSKSWTMPIPIYISMSDYNQGEHERNFILYQIGKHYLGKQKLNDQAFNQLRAILQLPLNNNPNQITPSFILFLDGMDEVGIEHHQLLDEIEEIANEAKGVQIVITHTRKLSNNWAKSFNTIELMPPQLDFKSDALSDSQFSESSLEELLQNPMMKEVYDDGAKVVNRHINNPFFNFKIPVTTRGELLWNSFEVELARSYEKNIQAADRPLFYYTYKFFMRHFLPYVAFLMEKMGVSSFTEDQLQLVIDEIIENIYQRHFLKTYKEYRRYFAYFRLEADNWVKEEERFEVLSTLLTNNFTMFIKEEEDYKFSHQLYRDFLGAVHIQNDITISLKRFKLPSSLRDRKLTTASNLHLLLGELEGEHYNECAEIETYNEHKTLLEQTLERCRNIFDKKVIGFTVWNILNVWQTLRGELSGLNLSYLDLRGFSLNGVKLQHQDHHQNQYSQFRNSLIDRNVFLAGSEKKTISQVRFSPSLRFSDKYPGYENEKVLLIATASIDGTVKLWDTTSYKCFDILDQATDATTAVDFSPCGKYLFAVSKDQHLRVWALSDRHLVFETQAHKAGINALRVAPSGNYLATASEDKTIKIWKKINVYHWEVVQTLKGHKRTVECIDFSPDGRYLVSGSWDRTIRLWDWHSGETIWGNHKHVSGIQSIAFSPDGQSILSGSSDDTMIEWDINRKKERQKYFGHQQGINSVAYSPDGVLVASASSDETIKIWDRATGKPIKTLKAHDYYVLSVMFSPDSQQLISSSADGTMKLWQLNLDAEEKADICRCQYTFSNYNGLHVQGVDFRHLHKDSHLPIADKRLLRQFGGIFNSEDENAWNYLVDRLCYLFEEENGNYDY